MAVKSYLDKIRIAKEPSPAAYKAWSRFKAAEILALWDKKGYTQWQRNLVLQQMELRIEGV